MSYCRGNQKGGKGGGGGGGGEWRGVADDSKLGATNDWGFGRLIHLFHLSTSKFKPC